MRVQDRVLLPALIAASLMGGAAFAANAQQNPARAAGALFASGKIKAGKDALLDCADARDAECQFLLAQKIEEGKHYVRDLATAKELYELSYRGGYSGAGPHVLRLAREMAPGDDSVSRPTFEIPAPRKPLESRTARSAVPSTQPAPTATVQPNNGGKKNIATPIRRPSTTSNSNAVSTSAAPSQEAMSGASSYDLCVLQAMLRQAPRREEVIVARRNAARELSARDEACEPVGRYQTAAAAELRKLGVGGVPSKGMRALSLISDILGAVGGGMSSGSRRVYGQTLNHDVKDCSSDYGCQVGQQCVKPPGRLSGQCMTTVNASGVPTLRVHRSSSLGPDTTPQCAISADCPIGFQCDVTLKACIKR